MIRKMYNRCRNNSELRIGFDSGWDTSQARRAWVENSWIVCQGILRAEKHEQVARASRPPSTLLLKRRGRNNNFLIVRQGLVDTK